MFIYVSLNITDCFVVSFNIKCQMALLTFFWWFLLFSQTHHMRCLGLRVSSWCLRCKNPSVFLLFLNLLLGISPVPPQPSQPCHSAWGHPASVQAGEMLEVVWGEVWLEREESRVEWKDIGDATLVSSSVLTSWKIHWHLSPWLTGEMQYDHVKD